MLRITTTEDSAGVTRLRVEGRITGETMNELRSECETRVREGRELVLEIGGVAYADAAGASLLRTLEARGVELAGGNGFVRELVGRAEPDDKGAVGKRVGAASAGEPTEDRTLIARLRAGDDEAFELLVRRFGGRLLAVARRILGNEDDARDALQDAFLSAFRGITSFTGESQLSTWLHRIVVNSALMRLRSRRRRPEDSIEDLLPRFADDGHHMESPTSWRSDELLERDDTRAAVRRCIDQLPERHREVLMLRDIEDLDTDEVAVLLGVTPNAVKVRLHRARQALRTLIEREIVER